MMSRTDDLSSKLIEYRNRAYVTRRAHYLAATKNANRNYYFGVPVTLITAIVGTAIFGSIQSNPDFKLKFLAGSISIIATVLSALQTYLGFSDKSSKHKEAGSRYAAIWRSFDVLDLETRSRGDEFFDEGMKKLNLLVELLNESAKESPTVPDYAYHTAQKELQEKLRSLKIAAS